MRTVRRFALAAGLTMLSAGAVDGWGQMMPVPSTSGVVSGAEAKASSVSAKQLSFDAVSLKPNKGGDGSMSWRTTADGFKMVNVGLIQIIEFAYGLNNATDEQVAGLSGWAKDAHFDLEAKVGEDDLPAYKELKDGKKNTMLVAVLQDRFKMKAHLESRELPIYELVVAKGGPKLKAADPVDTYQKGMKFGDKVAGPGAISMQMDGNAWHVEFQGCSLDRLVPNLTNVMGRKVIDRTGLTGKYDFSLVYASDDAKDDANANAPRLLTALQEQLGLRLNPAKGPVDSVVVDHVEQPTDN
jgi:uncharacterized protein (TIGR03435 family)